MTLLAGLCFAWFLTADVDAFNIDVINPIVLRSPSQRVDSRPTYFGFSLAFYQSDDGSASWCEYVLSITTFLQKIFNS